MSSSTPLEFNKDTVIEVTPRAGVLVNRRTVVFTEDNIIGIANGLIITIIGAIAFYKKFLVTSPVINRVRLKQIQNNANTQAKLNNLLSIIGANRILVLNFFEQRYTPYGAIYNSFNCVFESTTDDTPSIINKLQNLPSLLLNNELLTVANARYSVQNFSKDSLVKNTSPLAFPKQIRYQILVPIKSGIRGISSLVVCQYKVPLEFNNVTLEQEIISYIDDFLPLLEMSKLFPFFR